LVTGAAGYIGSILCTELINHSFDVVAADILKYEKNHFHIFLFKNFKFIKANISKPKEIKKYFKGLRFYNTLSRFSWRFTMRKI